MRELGFAEICCVCGGADSMVMTLYNGATRRLYSVTDSIAYIIDKTLNYNRATRIFFGGIAGAGLGYVLTEFITTKFGYTTLVCLGAIILPVTLEIYL